MEQYLQVGVKVILEREDGRILLLRRNPKKYPEIGPTWDIVGGRIEIGTPLRENLKREVQEETGLILDSEPELLYAQDILGVERFLGRHVVRLTYKAHISGEPVIDEESIEYGWFSVTEIQNMSHEKIDRFFLEVFNRFYITI